MSCPLYQEPLDPLRLRRHWADAGLAGEKHRWLLRTATSPDAPEAPFGYGRDPVRELHHFETDADGAPVLAVPAAAGVLPGEIPAPPLWVSVAPAPAGEVCEVAAALAEGAVGPAWLAFAPGVGRRADGEPVRADDLLAEVLGGPPDVDPRGGWVPLPDAAARRRAVAMLGTGWGHRAYLVAGDPPPEMRAPLAPRPGAVSHAEPPVHFAAFHALASACAWVLTTHGFVAGATAYCVYSRAEVAQALAAGAHGPVRIVADVRALNQAAGVRQPGRGGLALADLPDGMLPRGAEGLSLAWSDLDSLAGVDRFPFLRELEIDGTAVSGLSPLAAVPGLEALSARSVQLDSLRPLAALPGLRRLALNRMPDDGLAALAGLPALEELDLTLMPLDSAPPLPACAHLRRLVLDRTGLDSAASLPHLPALASLSLRRTPVRDVSLLAAHAALRDLALDGCLALDPASLAALAQLEELSLGGWGRERLELPDPGVVAALANLRRLAVRDSTLRAFPAGALPEGLRALDVSGSPVAGLGWLGESGLEELDVSVTQVKDLEPLRSLGSLHRLALAGCEVVDAEPLRALAGLASLDVGASWIEDFTFLEALPALRELRLSATRPARVPAALPAAPGLELLAATGWPLARLPWLGEATALRVLALDGSDLADTALLEAMTQLEDADLSRTPVASLHALAGARGLRRLRLDQAPVRDLEPLRKMHGLRELGLRGTRPQSLAPLAALPALRRLDLRQVDPRSVDLAPLLELPRLELLMIETHGIHAPLLDELRRRHRVFLGPT
ncbi:MAG TPA: hypothetical protein VNP72_09445 [Longimicrobium sp.]|nr:hypothetical protein [Longimicrobium sp.]